MSNATTTRHSADVGERAVRMFIERQEQAAVGGAAMALDGHQVRGDP